MLSVIAAAAAGGAQLNRQKTFVWAFKNRPKVAGSWYTALLSIHHFIV